MGSHFGSLHEGSFPVGPVLGAPGNSHIHRPKSYDMVAPLRPMYILQHCMEPLG